MPNDFEQETEPVVAVAEKQQRILDAGSEEWKNYADQPNGVGHSDEQPAYANSQPEYVHGLNYSSSNQVHYLVWTHSRNWKAWFFFFFFF